MNRFDSITHQDSSSFLLFLNLLENNDFYVRFRTLSLLSDICDHDRSMAQQHLLSSPMALSRLSDTLGDDREAVRNGKHSACTPVSHDQPELQY